MWSLRQLLKETPLLHATESSSRLRLSNHTPNAPVKKNIPHAKSQQNANKITSFPGPSFPDNRRETRYTARAATDLTRRRRPESPGTLIAAREKKRSSPETQRQGGRPKRHTARTNATAAHRRLRTNQRPRSTAATPARPAPPEHPPAPPPPEKQQHIRTPRPGHYKTQTPLTTTANGPPENTPITPPPQKRRLRPPAPRQKPARRGRPRHKRHEKKTHSPREKKKQHMSQLRKQVDPKNAALAQGTSQLMTFKIVPESDTPYNLQVNGLAKRSKVCRAVCVSGFHGAPAL